MMTHFVLLALLLLFLDPAAAAKRVLPSATSGHAASSNSLQEASESELIIEDLPSQMELETDVYDSVTTGLSHTKIAVVPIAAPAAVPVDPRMYDFAAALKASLAHSKKHEKDIVNYLS